MLNTNYTTGTTGTATIGGYVCPDCGTYVMGGWHNCTGYVPATTWTGTLTWGFATEARVQELEARIAELQERLERQESAVDNLVGMFRRWLRQKPGGKKG